MLNQRRTMRQHLRRSPVTRADLANGTCVADWPLATYCLETVVGRIQAKADMLDLLPARPGSE